ncbi:hypothetical protein AA106555_1078 [Neokomagataea thailandica NBRC 106555]|uniref:Transposase n=1 Tax=Neokomagataea thailandica NBRC 106555 TaxID=1223520 RepID=A0ABQ0QPZ1_9PROT|nr:hypothetical protein AA106555_1078 [Neokomagataea thailandica NBRC 106555]
MRKVRIINDRHQAIERLTPTPNLESSLNNMQYTSCALHLHNLTMFNSIIKTVKSTFD